METIIILLLLALLLFLLLDKRERFNQNKGITIKQCDFNDKNLSGKCKEIRDGCTNLISQEKQMKTKLASGCDIKNKEAKTVKETISQRRDCVTDVERYIRTRYARDELCARIDNMPKSGKDEKLKDLEMSNVLPNDLNGAFSDARF